MSACHCRLNENRTSSASSVRVGANRALEWNRTPGRRWNVYSLPSGDTSHDRARLGSIAPPGLCSRTRPSNMGSAAFTSVKLVTVWGSSTPGSASEQNTSVLAEAGAAAASRAAKAKRTGLIT